MDYGTSDKAHTEHAWQSQVDDELAAARQESSVFNPEQASAVATSYLPQSFDRLRRDRWNERGVGAAETLGIICVRHPYPRS